MSRTVQCINRLHDWYANNHRDLPFRENADPYRVWISEIMLQQTRVGAMIEKYNAFIKRFPKIEDLARAEQEEVLEYWSGLGYYSRAKNIHKTSRAIVSIYGGRFPSQYEDLVALPGIGDYTASAILSIALAHPIATVDGNVRRIIMRVEYSGETAQNHKTDHKQKEISMVRATADRWMERYGVKDPSRHNQSLMELGALVCTPRTPDCRHCPLRACCNAYRSGGVDLVRMIPMSKRTEKTELHMDLYIFLHQPDQNGERKVLLSKEQNSFFFKGMWFFPVEIRKAQDQEMLYRSPPLPELLPEDRPNPVGSFRHTITSYAIKINVYVFSAQGHSDAAESLYSYYPLSQARRMLHSSAAIKAISLVENEIQNAVQK